MFSYVLPQLQLKNKCYAYLCSFFISLQQLSFQLSLLLYSHNFLHFDENTLSFHHQQPCSLRKSNLYIFWCYYNNYRISSFWWELPIFIINNVINPTMIIVSFRMFSTKNPNIAQNKRFPHFCFPWCHYDIRPYFNNFLRLLLFSHNHLHFDQNSFHNHW